jgi:signal peptidase I
MAKRADRRRRRAGEPDVDGGLLTEEGSRKSSAGRARITSRLGVKQKPPTQANRPVPKKGHEPPGQGRDTKRPKSTKRSLLELAAIAAIAVMFALGIQAYLVKPYKIPSGSMEPTLKVGQRILVNRIGLSLNGPHVGEVVVFHPPLYARAQTCGPKQYVVTPNGAPCDQTYSKESSETFVKRVVAGPGDVIYISEGHVYRKAAGTSRFIRERDPYIAPCGGVRECDFPKPIKIPPGHWFMMGDNRGESDDSRFWGPVPAGWMVGGAFATYWPPDHIGTV